MSLFGDFSEKAFNFKQSKKEKIVTQSEHWSAAILSGSEDSRAIEEPIRSNYLKYFFGTIFIIVTVLSAQLFNLQVINGQKNLAYADNNRIRVRNIRAERGVIYDKNKQIIARNLANFDLIVLPNQLPKDEKERQALYENIAILANISKDEVVKKAEERGLKYSQPLLVATNISRDQALNVEEKSKDLKGFSLDTNPVREYLDGGSLSHFLGYTGRIALEDKVDPSIYTPTDLIGKNGLEKAYEPDLKGINGREQVEVNSSGKPIKLLASREAKAGNDLVLTIDKGLQEKMAQYLSEGLNNAGSMRGVAVAMDPNSGQILAAVSTPSYDNNLFAHGISNNIYNKLVNDPNKPLLNRIASGTYPIGSTIKPFDSAAALQEKVITPSTTIEDRGKIDVPNQYNPSIVYTFKGWKPEGLGVVNVSRAITWSSDIFFYVVSGGYQGFKGLGADRLITYLKKFGFGHKTGIDTNDEASGYVPTPDSKKARTGEPWYIGDTYNLAIGQGNLLATPLQLLIATSSIASGGTIYQPRLVKEIIAPEGKPVRTINPEVSANNFVSDENLRIIQEGMHRVVTEGTACCSIKNEVPVSVSGKTGTAETSSAGFDGKNSRTRPHAWFTSYAPSDKPTIAMVVLVENSGEGAEYAVPITKNILKWYFSPH